MSMASALCRIRFLFMAGLLRVYYALIIRRIGLSRTRRQGPVGEGPGG